MAGRVSFRYWGKAAPEAGVEQGWHPLPLHSLDVAAVGLVYLRQHHALRKLLCEAFQGNEEEIEDWLVFWLALHDLGKFATAFQSQKTDLMQALRPQAVPRPYLVRHDSLGMWFFKKVCTQELASPAWFGSAANRARMHGLHQLARAFCGHHGMPPDEGPHVNASSFDLEGERAALADFLQSLRSEILPRTDFAAFLQRQEAEAFLQRSQQLSWWLAGVAVLADWLGSNTEFFPYHPQPPASLQAYWQNAQTQAGRALAASEVLSRPLRAERDIHSLFPKITNASPLQTHAAQLELGAGPQIHLLEDVPGAGKTEAALVLVQRLLAAGQGDGFFIGLPSMATANAMYARLAPMYQGMFETLTSAVLAHGQRDLVEKFARSVLPAGPHEADRRQGDESASERCSNWLADHNKRALLSPVGIGTVDQGLLAVLPAKHQSLRLLGLLHKILVIDEVHACDAYMQTLLEKLLEFHAASGGSAVLLSATLPQQMKRKLLTAFAKGRGERAAGVALRAEAYPLASAWDSQLGVREIAIPTRSALRRTLPMRYLSEIGEVLQEIKQALAAGKAVCWLRNSVADLLQAQQLLAEFLPQQTALLFHARFALQQRLATEEEILRCFGSDSSPAMRAGRLVLASQVAEQSLDADFDLMVTDLAPIDRILQRAGRLHRHQRAQRGYPQPDPAPPCLLVYGPPFSAEPGMNWYRQTLPRAAKVYADHGQSWRSAKLILQGQVQMPEQARAWIETVFGVDAEQPPGLEKNSLQADAEAANSRSSGMLWSLSLDEGYRREGLDWWSEAKTPSRLGEESSTVLLLRWQDEKLSTWASHPDPATAAALSCLRMPARLLGAAANCERYAQALETFLPSLPGAKWMLPLVLTQKDGVWQGQARGAGEKGEVRSWIYDEGRGLLGG